MSWSPKPIDHLAASPLHLQVRHNIHQAVREGYLAPGDRLPAVRTLAEDYSVNRLTVLKAIRALARAGVLATTPGKGVFVSKRPRGIERDTSLESDFDGLFFEGLSEMPLDEDVSADRASEGLKAAMEDGFSKDFISFSVGFPPLETIPADTIRKRLNRLLRQPNQVAGLGYVPTEGDPTLLNAVTNLLNRRGLQLGPDDKILITSGAQQGIALCLQALVRGGDTLAVESPGYMGLIANCRLRGIPMFPVPVDRRGLNPERLRTAAKKQELRAVYVVPNYQNPTGVVQSLKRRRQILDVAAQNDMYVIEDDVYADLRFGGRSIPPMKSLPGGDRVIYISSFSKALAPGLRVGFLVASGLTVEALRRYKEADDISTGGLVQAVMVDLLESGFYDRHTVKVRREYRRRRDAMLDALSTHLAKPWIKITRPRGGMHLWVMFEKKLDIERLLTRCRAAGVSFAPGYLFFADGRKASSLRLNFSSHPVGVIEEGVRRLARSISEEEQS